MMTVPSPWHARAVTARVDQFQRCTGGEIRLEQYIPDFCRGEGFCGGFAGLFEVGLGALEDAKGASVYDARARVDCPWTGRGGAAGATWSVRGGGSRRRRGRRGVAAGET